MDKHSLDFLFMFSHSVVPQKQHLGGIFFIFTIFGILSHPNSRYYPGSPPRLLNLSKKLAKHTKQLETYDPLVQEMSEVASLDADYLLLLSALENKVEIKDLPLDSELRAYSGCRDNISVVEMGAGHRLILKKRRF